MLLVLGIGTMAQGPDGSHTPTAGEKVFAGFVALLLIGVFSFILVSNDIELDDGKMWIATVLIALLGAAFGAIVPGSSILVTRARA